MSWTVRRSTADDIPALLRADWAAFGDRPRDEHVEDARAFLEVDRTFVAVDGEHVVGTSGALSLELTVPGPVTVRVAGVTYVGVMPTHRRQGILTALIARVHDDARARNEPMAALLASEATIYGRFGYGVAVPTTSVEIERARAVFRRPVDITGRVRMLEPAEMADVLPGLHNRYRRRQPGEVSRSQAWWARRFVDRESDRRGAGARFAVVWEDPEPRGYVTYRVTQRWDDGVPNGTLMVEELIALTAEARAGLWQYCFGVDLVGVVKAGNVPVDEPLPWMLTDGRRAKVTLTKDFLWVCILDVEASLAGRGYAGDQSLVFEVAGVGRYRLTGGAPGDATCVPTDRPADLVLHLADLSAAYLGGVRFTTLARAGLVCEVTPGALTTADALFTVSPGPYCCTGF
jgi:predicted acetyltransferase